MVAKIDSVTARGKLKARRDPYWQRVSKGLFVGFRKMTGDTVGTWVVRYRSDSGSQVRHTLGSLDQFSGSERYDRAVEEAHRWQKHIRVGGDTERSTVLDACTSYARKVRELNGDKAADDLEYRFRRWISKDPIQGIELTKLTRAQINDFRQRLVAAPVKVGKSGNTRVRSKDTVNRDMAAVRAALNSAFDDGKTTSDFAWRKPLVAFKNVSKRREIYLDREQRRAFIALAPPDLARFIQGLSMIPLRPGALAALLVGDLEVRFDVLRIGKDKSGADRKIKLPPKLARFFKDAAGDRPATEPLLARADGQAWNKDAWKDPIKAAAQAAGLPPGTVAYVLRHSAISDLVHGGLDLLTVAQISGTSVAMIEKHYGHLRGDVAAAELAKLAL
jgi:hypothetical protein